MHSAQVKDKANCVNQAHRTVTIASHSQVCKISIASIAPYFPQFYLIFVLPSRQLAHSPRKALAMPLHAQTLLGII